MSGNAGTVKAAARVRTAVRAAVRGGQLGELPAGLKVGVRSGVDAIYIEIEGAPADWAVTVEPDEDHPYRHSVGSLEACALATDLMNLACARPPGRSVFVMLGVSGSSSIRLA